MGNQNPLFRPGGFTVDADLSAKQYYAVKITGNKQVGLCSVAGEKAYGILQNKPSASGQAATIERLGISKMVFGEAIAAGDLVGVDANGKGKIVEGSGTGADVGQYVIGECVDGAGADGIGSVDLGIKYKVESVA